MKPFKQQNEQQASAPMYLGNSKRFIETTSSKEADSKKQKKEGVAVEERIEKAIYQYQDKCSNSGSSHGLFVYNDDNYKNTAITELTYYLLKIFPMVRDERKRALIVMMRPQDILNVKNTFDTYAEKEGIKKYGVNLRITDQFDQAQNDLDVVVTSFHFLGDQANKEMISEYMRRFDYIILDMKSNQGVFNLEYIKALLPEKTGVLGFTDNLSAVNGKNTIEEILQSLMGGYQKEHTIYLDKVKLNGSEKMPVSYPLYPYDFNMRTPTADQEEISAPQSPQITLPSQVAPQYPFWAGFQWEETSSVLEAVLPTTHNGIFQRKNSNLTLTNTHSFKRTGLAKEIKIQGPLKDQMNDMTDKLKTLLGAEANQIETCLNRKRKAYKTHLSKTEELLLEYLNALCHRKEFKDKYKDNTIVMSNLPELAKQYDELAKITTKNNFKGKGVEKILVMINGSLQEMSKSLLPSMRQ